VEDALADDAPPTGARVNQPAPRKEALPSGAAMPGMIAPAEKLPARQRVRNALGSYPKDAAKRQQKLAEQRRALMASRPGAVTTEQTGQMPSETRRRKSNANLGGYLVALILLVIFAAIAITVISGIIEAIGGAFD
ncbi:MAG: hypothetical protein ACRDQW_02740, partial [Haloechinothrix sp.]